MSLRVRLILAFLLMSVLPLTAVTLYSYASSVGAFQRVVEAEAKGTASEMGRRMEIITADLGRRVDQLFEEGDAVDAPEEPAALGSEAFLARVAPMLGDTAAFLESVEFTPAVEAAPAPGTNPAPAPVPGAAPGSAARTAPPAPPAPPGAPAPPHILIDVRKLVEEAAQAAAREAGSEGLSPEIARLIGEGLNTGIQAGMAGAAAGMRAAAAAVSERAQARAREVKAERAGGMAIEGRDMELPVRREGRLVGKVNARLNLERTLTTVLSMTRTDQGEIPFAVDKEGRIYTPKQADKAALTSLGVAKIARRGATVTEREDKWVIVTRRDPSGLSFGLARPIGDSLRDIRQSFGRNLGLGLGVIGLAAIGIIPVSRRMTRNLSALTDGVRQIARGDFQTRVPVRSPDEFGLLADAFNQMAKDLEAHQKLVVEQERLRRELELSRLIQNEMLPRGPLKSGIAEVKGLSIQASEVGGDFFNYFALSDTELALLVGDVSGKGVGAALLMANVQATLRARLPFERDLATLADALDREIEQNTPREVYLTLFVGILDTAKATLRYVNAGHHPQFVLRAAGGLQKLGSHGLPIGLFAGHGYTEDLITLDEGDLLFFYTDGMVETEDETGDMFGSDRLEALLTAHHDGGIDVVLDRIERAVRTFRGKAEPFDDATMMVLRFGKEIIA